MIMQPQQISPLFADYCRKIVPRLPAADSLSPFDYEEACRKVCGDALVDHPLKINATEALIAFRALTSAYNVDAIDNPERQVALFLLEAIEGHMPGRRNDMLHTRQDALARLDFAIEHIESSHSDMVSPDALGALILDLVGGGGTGTPDDDFYDAKVTVLSEMIEHHVKEEEKRSEGLFAQASAAGLDVEALGARMLARKQELTAQFKASGVPSPETRSFMGHELKQGVPVSAAA